MSHQLKLLSEKEKVEQTYYNNLFNFLWCIANEVYVPMKTLVAEIVEIESRMDGILIEILGDLV